MFVAAVGQDKDLPAFGHAAYAGVESVETADPQSVVVTWKRPYIDADTMFSRSLAPPLPRHLLYRALR